MPTPCIAKLLPIREMIHLKSLVMSILNSFKIYYIQQGHPPFAFGPLEFEDKSLERAMEELKITSQEVAFFCFLSTFSNFNQCSVVTYLVGIHQYSFKHEKKRLENKIMFCLNPDVGKAIDRGGCLVGHRFIYMLLDW